MDVKQQELGLVPKASTKVDVTTHPARHEVFTFLTPEQAMALKKLEADVESGAIDVLEFYRAAGPVFKWEQEAHERAALEAAP